RARQGALVAADGEGIAGGERELLALLGELGLHEEDDLLRRLLVELGAARQLVGRELEDGLGRVAADVLEALDDLGGDGVGELLDVDVLLVGADVPVDVELVAGELRGEADVLAAAADGHRDLVGGDGDAGARGVQLVVDLDGDGLGRRQRPLDELDGVRRPRDHVDVLVAELADDGVDPGALHADAGADGVDAVVVADDGDLRAVARLAHDGLDLDDAVVDLGHLELEEPLDEHRRRPADHDLRAGAGVADDLLDDGPEHVALPVAVLVDLALLREHQLGLVVDDEDLLPAGLVDLPDDDLADELGVLPVDVLLLDVADLLAERLERRLHGAPPEVVDGDGLGHLVPDLVVLVDGEGVALLDLGHGVLEVVVLDDLADVDDLDVAVVGVEDDLEVVVGAVALLDHGAEDVLDDDLERVAVDVILARDLGAGGAEGGALDRRRGLRAGGGGRRGRLRGGDDAGLAHGLERALAGAAVAELEGEGAGVGGAEGARDGDLPAGVGGVGEV